MAKQTFQGRPILPGAAVGEATVARGDFEEATNTKASGISGRQVNDDCSGNMSYRKDLNEAISCLPETIGLSRGDFVLMGVSNLDMEPKALLFSKHVDSSALGGLLMADIWMDERIVAVDLLGEEFLEAVHNGDTLKVYEDGKVEIG